MNRDDVPTRVLLLSPTRKDGEITSSLLTNAGLSCVSCHSLPHLAREVDQGADAILLTEEAIGAQGIQDLLRSLERQPTWSDVPVVMLMKSGVASPVAAKVLRDLRNVTLLERPAPMRSILSAVQAAVRGRLRQYQIRDQLEAIQNAQEERQQLLESERAARQEAERASRIKDEFLANLGHELRTPLNAIFGWAQLIKMYPGDMETVTEGVNIIDRNVRIQTQLIEDLLDISRIISGKVRLEVQRVELAEVIDAALESVMPALLAKEIRIERVIDASIGAVSGDPNRLQQVFWNLLTNAVKFTPRGGKVVVRVERVVSHLKISVTDTGEGIAPEFLPQLFERFTQADGSTTRKHGGLGLGLSIVRNLVEMHGGTISAKSPGIGHGSTFTVCLPLRSTVEPKVLDGHDASLNGKLLRDPAKLKGLRILVVDDEADSRELVRRVLTECAAVPALAASAAEAFSLILSFEPNLIISDIGMPIQDGYSFIREVRSRGFTTPALALTAFARPEDRTRAIQAGFQQHLAKPVDPIELLSVVVSLAKPSDL